MSEVHPMLEMRCCLRYTRGRQQQTGSNRPGYRGLVQGGGRIVRVFHRHYPIGQQKRQGSCWLHKIEALHFRCIMDACHDRQVKRLRRGDTQPIVRPVKHRMLEKYLHKISFAFGNAEAFGGSCFAGDAGWAAFPISLHCKGNLKCSFLPPFSLQCEWFVMSIEWHGCWPCDC